uniref:J domain-containing protein n=1 Tax=Anopheles culicifacies TaxID=139723 RepID=A0A182MK04_9DIPT
MEDEYADTFGQSIKVVYQPQPQQQQQAVAAAAATGMIPCAQEDTNLTVQDKQGYELFSNKSSFVLSAPGFGFTLHNPQRQQQQHQQQQQQQRTQQLQQQPQQLPQFSIATAQAAMTAAPALRSHPATSAPVPTSSGHPLENGNSNTSTLISQLVGNWAPTISGTYGNGPPSQPSNDAPTQSLIAASLEDSNKTTVSPTKTGLTKPAINPVPPNVVGAASKSHGSSSGGSPTVSVGTTRTNTNVATAVYNQQNDDNSAKLDQNVNKKQRIVAEVKPMRMSYSDVLSKNVSTGGNAFASNAAATAMLNGEVINVLPAALGNGTKVAGSNGTNGGTGGKSKRDSKRANGERKSLGSTGAGHQKERAGFDATTRKVNGAGIRTISPTQTDGSAKVDLGTDMAKATGQEKGRKHDKATIGKKDKNFRTGTETLDGTGLVGRKARTGAHQNEGSIEDIGGLQNKPASMGNDETEEERAEEYDEYDSDEYDQDSFDSSETNGQQDARDDAEGQEEELPFVYNVKKNTNGSNDTHIEKINPPRAAATYRKGGGGRNVGPRGPGKQQDKMVGSPPAGKRSVRARKNHKYAFLEKLFRKWLEYMVLALHWLWSLVSDVVYLSVRLAWDYVLSGYQYCWQHVCTLRQDFGKNSGRPGAWFRRVWQSFDGRFAKDSRWAFWRRCRRQKPVEPVGGKPTPYRDGRLPSTADEAMSSLLNCKGKDAYSILGVSPDCSQEQIRKHYKKIAVLVHPDKNKQPGAEEAFKVLQRSFELIGEPESRKEYDQSLAEALNAEKAWSEINDLLTQLHTKISEAANTIRCSSCCLRHPRKPTGRPHYAARECSSCKIRHPAREGDIWAETSFFGLRWKYLAMMEGNVEPNLDDFLNNIYAGQTQQAASQNSSSRRRYRRN